MDVNEEVFVLKNREGGGGQGECERRFKVFGKMQKKNPVGDLGRGSGLGGGGFGWISEVFAKIQKQFGGRSGWMWAKK